MKEKKKGSFAAGETSFFFSLATTEVPERSEAKLRGGANMMKLLFFILQRQRSPNGAKRS